MNVSFSFDKTAVIFEGIVQIQAQIGCSSRFLVDLNWLKDYNIIDNLAYVQAIDLYKKNCQLFTKPHPQWLPHD